MRPTTVSRRLKTIYRRLHKRFGSQGWWPADTRLEMMVGAILTQNTAWTNVEKAIRNLKRASAISSVKSLHKISSRELASLIVPAGYYNIKARRLKNLTSFFISRYNGDLTKFSDQKTRSLGEELLSVNGVGPETRDSILLYAFNRPVFVVDAYTKRIFQRHGMIKGSAEYDDVQRLFMDNLPHNEKLFNEYHALIVRLAKDHCKKRPDCGGCPLKSMSNNNPLLLP
jgi:endonuclease-3 related protein